MKKKRLILIVRADPIICRHATEARNLAEAAIGGGFSEVRIVTWPLSAIEDSGLPWRQPATVDPYSPGILVERPEAVGDPRVLDGGLLHGMSGHITELLMDGVPTTIVSYDLVPHAQVAVDSVETTLRSGRRCPVHTIAEAAGTDVTRVVRRAIDSGHFGPAQRVLSTFLANDCPVATSEYTRSVIIDHASAVDRSLGTRFAAQLGERLRVSYPALHASPLVAMDRQTEQVDQLLAQYRLARNQFILFLSRVAEAKGVADLIQGYQRSLLRGVVPLVIAGTGAYLHEAQRLAADDPSIHFLGAVDEIKKRCLMHACSAFVLPTKPQQSHADTFCLAVAEKMLCGGTGPVITTRVGGVSEATGDNCLYVRPGEPGDIALALDRALLRMSSDSKRMLSERARGYAMQFDRDRVLINLMGTLRRAA